MREMEMTKRRSSARTVALFFCVLTLLVSLFACESEDRAGRKGLLKFELEVDTTALSTTTKTKAGSDEFAEFLKTADYAVDILQGSTSVNSWERLDKMPESIELKPGTYQINVSKGSKEGAAFESPYFAGSSNFVIEEGMTTPLNVSASIANAKVTVEYSKDFLEAYTAYELTLKSSKMTLPIVYKQSETRAIYFQCDTSGTAVKIGMTLTNLYGKEINYNTSFTAKPKQWLRLNVKTDGEAINGLAVDIILNDEVIKTEHVTIGIPDFMDDLKGAPVLAITEDSPFHWLSETYPEPMVMNVGEFGTNASLNIFAGGKIGNCRLSITNEQETVFDYDLANLTEEQKAALNDRWSFKVGSETEDDFAADAKGSTSVSLNLLNILNELDGAASEMLYTGTLTITDMLPIANTTEAKFQVKLNVPAVPVLAFNERFITEMNEGVFPADKVEAEQTVSIVAKGRIKSCVLKVIDEKNSSVISEKEITEEEGNVILKKSERDKVATVSFKNEWFKLLEGGEAGIRKYRVVIEVTDEISQIEKKDIVIAINPPVFWAMEKNGGDVYAKHAVLRVKAPNKDYVSFYKDGVCISEGKTLLEKDGIVSFVWDQGVDANTSYTIQMRYGDYEKSTSFVTEEELQLPNSDFENWDVQNWTYIVTLVGDRTDNNYNFIPQNWNTNNNETLLTEVPNNYVIVKVGEFSQKLFPAVAYSIDNQDEKSALVRSVSANTFNTDVIMRPAVAGRLYYRGRLQSRPKSLSYSYKYNPYKSDKFKVSVKITGENGNTLSEKTYIPAVSKSNSSFESTEIPLDYVIANEKASEIDVYFYSSESNEPPTEKSRKVTLPSPNGNTYKTHTGSVLMIDDVKLNY